MPDEMKNKLVSDQIAQIKDLFGPPPVLSSENIEAYDEIIAGFIRREKPQDVLALMLIRRMADEAWKILRHTRHQVLAINRRERHNREAVAFNAKAEAIRKHRTESNAELFNIPLSELPSRVVLAEAGAEILADIHEMIDRAPNELEHARAFEHAIDYYERLDRLNNTAAARLDDCLVHLRLNRQFQADGQTLVPAPAIEGEFKQIETQPSETTLVPSGDEQQ